MALLIGEHTGFHQIAEGIEGGRLPADPWRPGRKTFREHRILEVSRAQQELTDLLYIFTHVAILELAIYGAQLQRLSHCFLELLPAQ